MSNAFGVSWSPLLVTVVSLVQPVAALAAQERRLIDYVPHQSEQSELGFQLAKAGTASTILEGRIAPHLFLNDQRGRFGLELTPKTHLRIFKAESAPVWSPSFMPRLTVYYAPSTGSTFFSLLLSHHSNGQDGPFFDENGDINQIDGSFSTNFFELALHRVALTGLFRPTEEPAILVSSAGLEWHPGFNQTDELDGRYSMWRVNTRFDYERPRSLVKEVDLDVTIMLGDVEDLSTGERVNLELTLRFSPSWIDDARVFTKFYWGQDYYNSRFADRIGLFLVGLSVDFATWSPLGV